MQRSCSELQRLPSCYCHLTCCLPGMRIPGKYNWDAVNGLEKIVGWCRAYGIKLIIAFIDNWSTVDSKMSVRIAQCMAGSSARAVCAAAGTGFLSQRLRCLYATFLQPGSPLCGNTCSWCGLPVTRRAQR